MIFFFDHDVPEDAAYALKAMDHQVIRLREVLPTTTRDEDVFQYANDNDYGDEDVWRDRSAVKHRIPRYH